MQLIRARVHRAWLAIALAACTAAPTSGQEEGGSDDATEASTTGVVTLAADRLRYWDSDATRFVLLEGSAEVSQGLQASSRASAILVRIRSNNVEGRRIGVVEVFEIVERNVSSVSTAKFATERPVMLKARSTEGIIKLDRAPDNMALWPDKPAEAVEPPAPIETPSLNAPSTLLNVTNATPLDEPPVVPSGSEPKTLDSKVSQAQDLGDGPDFSPLMPREVEVEQEPDEGDALLAPPIEDEQEPSTDAVALPGVRQNANAPEAEVIGSILPQSRRVWSITPRYGGRPWQIETVNAADGSTAFVIRGGVTIVSESTGIGRVDLSADNAVIWLRQGADGRQANIPNPAAGRVEQNAEAPLEAYLEGDVIIRHDRLEQAGAGDQTTFKGRQIYYDFPTDRVMALDGEFEVFAPGLITPMRSKGQVIQHFHEPAIGPDGRPTLGPAHVRIDRSSTTGSRFPEPGYRFDSKTIDITEVRNPLIDPATGGRVGPMRGGSFDEINWLIDARQNTYYIGPVPFFYWPRFRAESDDLDPPIRNFGVRYGNYFGYQVLTDWNGFKLLGIEKPKSIGNWNLDIDYLSFRGPALGSEMDWFGRDLIADIFDPYGKRRLGRSVDMPYFGYSDSWGIIDNHNDVLGSGPAVVTYGPPGAGKAGYQRINVPSFLTYRGRYLTRHMQSLLGPDADPDDDLRVQFEMAAYSDRHFLEQYYKRLFDSGLDQDTLAYMIYQRRNRAVTLTGQVNFMDWITDTQWLPKLEYYRIGDTMLNNRVSYSSNYGVDYANVHTAVEVNNPNIFAFIPFDPISNTSRPFASGRAWTTQQAEIPLKFGFVNIVPYLQGQVMGWSNQLDYQTTGRAWGAYGARANIMTWKIYSEAESELLNVHGLAHKATLNIDYRASYSTLNLQRVGVQDVLDDDTYEFTRRYFALTNYVGGVLPTQYDPRYLLLRRTLNPVVFAPDIQDEIETFTVGIFQRLQTKRGPEGRRRIVDWMVLDAKTTFYPRSNRDNFGEPIGQTMYNYEWFIGDRTSIISTGWFEFWDIVGNPILVTEPRKSNDPFGLRVINAGVSINRPPRGNVYFGYSIINTGPIATSALNSAFNYWLSPKWYASFATSYDFGNAILLGSTFSVTKIGSDFLTSIGLSVDPQRQNYTFGLEIAPRFSPSVRLGSAVGTRFDSRFAPTQ